MPCTTSLRHPRRVAPGTGVVVGVLLPAIGVLSGPGGGVPVLAGGLASVVLVGMLAWLAARAVSEPTARLEIALATALAVTLLAPVATSLLVPALIGVAWLGRRRPPRPANDNAMTAGQDPVLSWRLIDPARTIAVGERARQGDCPVVG